MKDYVFDFMTPYPDFDLPGLNEYAYLSPVVGIIGGLWFLNEEMSYIGVMGVGMILCGVVCAQTGLVRVAAEMAKRW